MILPLVKDVYLVQELELAQIKPLELEDFNEEENDNIILSETD